MEVIDMVSVESHRVVGVEMKLSKHTTFWAFKVNWISTTNLLEDLLNEAEKNEEIKHYYRENHELCLYINKKYLNQFLNNLQKTIEQLQKELQKLDF